MQNIQESTPNAAPKQYEKLSAVIAKESSKDLQKKFVAALLSIIGFAAFVPKGAAGLAETFDLDIGLAFRMFAALYFSLPMLLIILWHIDLVMKERSQNEDQIDNKGHYAHWFNIRLPLLLAIISIYLGFVIILPILADEIITTAALVLAGIGIYYLYIKFVAHGKDNLLFHTPFLVMIIILLSSIGLYAVPWSKLTHRIAIVAIIVGITWIIIEFFLFSKIPSERSNSQDKLKPGGKNSLLAGSTALCLIAIILWYPSEIMRPTSYQSADTAIFNIALIDTNHSQYFSKIIQINKEAKANDSGIKDTTKRTTAATSIVEKEKKGSFSQHALQFVQWRGIALLLIPMIGLVLYRYQCRRYGTRSSINRSPFLTQPKIDKRVQITDAWLVTLAVMLIMLFEPASDPAKNKNIESKKDQYAAFINAPQWYLPGSLMDIFQGDEVHVNNFDNKESATINENLQKIFQEIKNVNQSLKIQDSILRQQNFVLGQQDSILRQQSLLHKAVGSAVLGADKDASHNSSKGIKKFNEFIEKIRRSK